MGERLLRGSTRLGVTGVSFTIFLGVRERLFCLCLERLLWLFLLSSARYFSFLGFSGDFEYLERLLDSERSCFLKLLLLERRAKTFSLLGDLFLLLSRSLERLLLKTLSALSLCDSLPSSAFDFSSLFDDF